MSFVSFTKEGHIGIVTINRPDALNALNSMIFLELSILLDEIERDKNIYVLIFTGAGRAFVAGSDIKEMSNMTVIQGKAFGDIGNKLFLRLEMCQKPTIAAINGIALGGGCELAMACDIRIASKNAKFGHPEVNLGIIPGAGGTCRMPRIVGIEMALRLILSGTIIDAKNAKQIGLVSHVTEPYELMELTMALANRIANQPQYAVYNAKREICCGVQCDINTAVSCRAFHFTI